MSPVWIDGLIIFIYFFGIIAIGLSLGRREDKLSDFALGGRAMPWWAVMASIIAAETSAATFLGTPAEGYTDRNFGYVQLIVGLIIGRVIVGYVFIKPYFAYRVYTVYDYLAIRFGPLTKNYISALFLVMRTLASGTRLFIPSLVVVLAWKLFSQSGPVKYGVIQDSTLPYFLAIVGLTIATCAYTSVGGIKAVIWTDVIQATLMFGSAIVAIGTLIYHIGGDSMNLLKGLRVLLEKVPALSTYQGYFLTGFEEPAVKAYMTKYSVPSMTLLEYIKLILVSKYTVFSALIGATLANMAAFGTDQDMVQRLLTAETYQRSRRSLITAAIMDLPIAGAFCFIGILLFVYFEIHPQFKPEAPADVFGSYILNVMPVGIRGLVLAGIFATAMGSFSAALNALATSFTNDWYIPYFARNRSEDHHVFAARLFTVVFAVLMVIIATIFAYAKVKYPDIGILPVVLGIAGLILGPMLGVFLLGMFTKTRGHDALNPYAIILGLVATLAVTPHPYAVATYLAKNLISPDAVVRSPFWEISFTWYAVTGAMVTLGIGLLMRTPQSVLDAAKRREEQAGAAGFDDRPLALRNDTQ